MNRVSLAREQEAMRRRISRAVKSGGQKCLCGCGHITSSGAVWICGHSSFRSAKVFAGTIILARQLRSEGLAVKIIQQLLGISRRTVGEIFNGDMDKRFDIQCSKEIIDAAEMNRLQNMMSRLKLKLKEYKDAEPIMPDRKLR